MKVILIIITWLGLVMPKTVEIEQRSMAECEKLKHRIEMAWIDGDPPEEFGYIMECQARE